MILLRRQFEATVSTLCQAVVAGLQPSDVALSEKRQEEVTRFVLSQHRQLVDYLRPAMFVVVLFFDWWGVLRRGKRFHRQDLKQRCAQAQSWRNSRLTPFRDFIRFHDVLTLFRLHS